MTEYKNYDEWRRANIHRIVYKKDFIVKEIIKTKNNNEYIRRTPIDDPDNITSYERNRLTQWTCEICKVTIKLTSKLNHLKTIMHKLNS